MIKTMLLTAQLALSPIVGTNGLQPKRLPNPVYGETIDYSVTYNGETYIRVFSGNYYAEEIKFPKGSFFIGYGGNVIPGKPISSDELTWTNATNIQKGSTDWYYSFTETGTLDETILPEGKWAFSFWAYDGQELIYNEAFIIISQNDNPQEYWQCWKWVNNDSTWVLDESLIGNYKNLKEGQTLTTYKPVEQILDYGAGEPRKLIPDEQPAIENPSVYDNIYNFYYQNLFANEALDELGAKVGNNSLTMRQWLAHTATIVSISLLAAALVFLVIKIFKLIAGSISDIWG